MRRAAFAVIFAASLAACGGGNIVKSPSANPVDPVLSNRLQFAVGIATISSNNGTTVAYGLNTVETLRQANGLSGLLYDVPTITGPTTFSVSKSTTANASLSSGTQPATGGGGGGGLDAGADFQTNRISQATLNDGNYVRFFSGPGSSLYLTSPTSAGAFGYGFCACNATSGPVNGVPQLYNAYSLPIYGGQTVLTNIGVANYYGGPPAFPNIDQAVAQAGFVGYSLGFVDFAVQPVLGTYRLDVAVPPDVSGSSNSQTQTQVLTTNAQLTSTAGLPVFQTPAFASDGNGGGSVTVQMPAGAAEAMVVVQARGITTASSDPCAVTHTITSFYTMLVTGSGTQTVTLPDNVGPLDQNGNASRTICAQQFYAVYAAAFDYPAYESAYPQSLSQTPVITSSSGQADVTTSDAVTGTYQ